MSNPITVDNLGTLIINDKNLPLQSDFNLLINQFDQFNNLVLNNSGNIVTWVAPISILSITSQSSLPDSYILIKNFSTKQRITLDGNLPLHSSDVSKIISFIKIIVNEITYNLDLTTSGIVINPVNRTIDFNYIATDLSQHVIKIKLKSASTIGIGTEIDTEYTISVLTSNIFQFPTINNTTKNSPHDTLDITVGQTLSMSSIFSDNIHSDIVSTVIINDGFTNINAVSNISDSNINYSFTITNDSDHSGTITLSFGDINNGYSWSATGLLTALNDIYTFPNIISYDGTSNGYHSGMHLKLFTPSNLVLTFTGGDQLHSNTYETQVSLIQYKTGNTGSLVTISSSDVTINSATGYETITLANIVATAVDNVYFYITLNGPDGATMASPATPIISSSAVAPIIPEFKSSTGSPPGSFNSGENISQPSAFATADSSGMHTLFFTVSTGLTISFNAESSHGSSTGSNLYEISSKDAHFSDFSTAGSVSNGSLTKIGVIGPTGTGYGAIPTITLTDYTKVYAIYYHGGGYGTVMNIIDL